MGKDKWGIERGKCIFCFCEEFDLEGSILCEYCGYLLINYFVLEDCEQVVKKLKRSNYEQEVEVEDSFENSVIS